MVNTLKIIVNGEEKFMILSYLELDNISVTDFLKTSTNTEINRILDGYGFCYDDMKCYWDSKKISIQKIKEGFDEAKIDESEKLNDSQLNAFSIIRDYISDIRSDKIKTILL